MNLTKDFTLEEFTNSTSAENNDISNVPAEIEVYRMVILCERVFQPLRDRIGKPIIIHSGFRCRKLNKLIGGANNSQHLKGEAADFHIPGMQLKDAYSILQKEFIYDQAILELDKWIHVSYNLWKNRMETLVAYTDNERIKYKKYSP